jgi:hypothetical protein
MLEKKEDDEEYKNKLNLEIEPEIYNSKNSVIVKKN